MTAVRDFVPTAVDTYDCHLGVTGICSEQIAGGGRPAPDIYVVPGDAANRAEVLSGEDIAQVSGADISDSAMEVDVIPVTVCALKHNYDIALVESSDYGVRHAGTGAEIEI